MGALPSRETHQRGLYSHRHGRNRRSEIILIPLTSTFFPSPDCPLFMHLYNSRYRRTAKYYYRALRSTETSQESDYFCTCSRISEPEEFEKFNKERLSKRKPQTGKSGSPNLAAEGGGSSTRPAVVDDYDYQSFTDTPEGLYHVLITENDLCVYDTDAQLRDAYARQVRHQRTEWERQSKRYMFNSANPASNPSKGFTPEMPSTFENVPYDAFLSGYAAAKAYMRGKRAHVCENCSVVNGDQEEEDGGDAVNHSGEAGQVKRSRKCKHCKHITSPAAYYIHPIPCAIASRWDANKPAPVDDPLYVQFEGFYVKIMGMFGTFPSTVVMRTEGKRPDRPPRPFPRKEGNPGGDYADSVNTRRGRVGSEENDYDDSVSVMEQHMLKGTMFIDKDVGDQILGNMVMLATHMYVRQCVGAQIRPRYLPSMPFFMRFPMSNVPMLQFMREFRVRLRTLLEAGTAKSGQKPMHVGMSGFNPMDIAEAHHQLKAKLEEEGYLFEDDIPDVLPDTGKLFMAADEARGVSFTSHSTSINTNEKGRFPIFMLSGFNVQNTPLRNAALSETGYTPSLAKLTQLQQSQSPSPATSKPSHPFADLMASSPTGGTHHNHPFNSSNSNAPSMESGADIHNSSPNSPTTAVAETATVASETFKSMLLLRRKNRFRLWIEDGHMCLWASAAYTRRACLILAQQLNTTVDNHSVPDPRSWVFKGLLYPGTEVPTPKTANDVLVVAEDIPSAGLWQGDVLRCCTAEEARAMQQQQPLPLPCRSADQHPASPTSPASPADSANSPTMASTGAGRPLANDSNHPGTIGCALGGNEPESIAPGGIGGLSLENPLQAAGTTDAAGRVNFTSNHPSNPLLQEQHAPANAFWVLASGGLDDSYTNISESNMPPHPKMAKQRQQAAHQRAKKLAAAAAALKRLYACAQSKGGSLGGLIPSTHNSSDSAAAATAAAASLALSMASDFLEIDRREGTLNLEEVVLAWVRVVSILSRDSFSETDGDWVRDPSGNPVRVDRFVFRRLEFEGVRFFIGVTPRFVGQQRRIEKVLGEIHAMEKRSSKQAQQEDTDSEEGSNNSPAGPIAAHRPAEKRKSKMPAVLGPEPPEDDYEDYDDVLERMGFGPRRLREAFEQSTEANRAKQQQQQQQQPKQQGTSASATSSAAGPSAEGRAAANATLEIFEDDIQALLDGFSSAPYRLTEEEA